MIFNVSELESQDSYRLLTGGIILRPIVWVSTRSIDGVDNLPAGGTVVFLDVQCIYVKDELYEKNSSQISQQLTDSVWKLGGDFYSLTTNKIELERP